MNFEEGPKRGEVYEVPRVDLATLRGFEDRGRGKVVDARFQAAGTFKCEFRV